MSLVTIDFHNTLFQCDEWFQLEIERLPAAFLQWSHVHRSRPDLSEREPELRAAYREIRTTVMSSGQECDAVTSLRLVLGELGISAPDSEVEQGVHEIMRNALKTAEPIEGAVKLVDRLHAQGRNLAVVSSAAYHPFLEWCLETSGMRHAFSEVITSASCGIYKSDPAIYTYALDRHQTAPCDAVHIGDSHRFDVRSAHLAGMHTILFSEDQTSKLEPAPDAVIQTLAEAPRHVGRLLND